MEEGQEGREKKLYWYLIRIHLSVQNHIFSLQWLPSFHNKLLSFPSLPPAILHYLVSMALFPQLLFQTFQNLSSRWCSQPLGLLDSWWGFQDCIKTIWIWIYNLFQSRADLAWQLVGCDKHGIPASFWEADKYLKVPFLFHSFIFGRFNRVLLTVNESQGHVTQ